MKINTILFVTGIKFDTKTIKKIHKKVYKIHKNDGINYYFMNHRNFQISQITTITV